jgi:transposase
MPAATVHRTCRISLRLTPAQRRRCFALLVAGGDVWAWALDINRDRHTAGLQPIVTYPDWCRQLAHYPDRFGELSSVGARSVLNRYAAAWAEAARRRTAGRAAGFPRRKRRLFPLRFYNATFAIEDRRVRLPVARGQPPLWLRLARPLPYPLEVVRSVTLLYDGTRLVVDVTAELAVEDHRVNPARVAGVDLGIIHPYAVAAGERGLLVSGRAIRAEDYLHLADRKARARKAAPKAPKSGQRGSRRWRQYRRAQRQAEVRHRRRVRQAHHEAAGAVVRFAIQQGVGRLLVGDPKGITDRSWGRRHNLRLRHWRRTHLVRVLRDKAQLAGITMELVDERGSSSTCPQCRRRVPKPAGRNFTCSHCGCIGHRDLVGAHNIVATAGGGMTSTVPVLVEHRRAGQVPTRRDRRRHLQDRRRGSCLASGRPAPAGRRSPGHHPAAAVAAVGLVCAACVAAPGED